MLIPQGWKEGAGAMVAEFVIVRKLSDHEAKWDAGDSCAGNLAG